MPTYLNSSNEVVKAGVKVIFPAQQETAVNQFVDLTMFPILTKVSDEPKVLNNIIHLSTAAVAGIHYFMKPRTVILQLSTITGCQIKIADDPTPLIMPPGFFWRRTFFGSQIGKIEITGGTAFILIEDEYPQENK